jgi:spore coat polysaccharide biosynthesis protein SpsF
VAAREHVTLLIYTERAELFLRHDVVDDEDNSDLRWTVDMPADLELVRRLHEELDVDATPYRELIAHVRARPELVRINAGIETWAPR